MESRFFVLQVITGEEARVLRRAGEALTIYGIPQSDLRLWWPRRKLKVRRKGRRFTTLAPLFPGYLILETRRDDNEMFREIRRISGVVRFLRSNDDIRPLEARDLELVRHFLSFGEIITESRVTFDENNRILVSEGPLQGLEGMIVKVDRRKGRAKVKLDMYDDSFLIDLAFEVLRPSEAKQ